jgi:hypothetical protein
MLDLEKRTPEQQKIAENAVKDGNLLSELLSGLLSKKSVARYKSFKVVYLISEEHPEVLYPKWDFFEDMLKSKDNTLKFQAIHVLANLAKVDTASRFEKAFDQFYDTVNGATLRTFRTKSSRRNLNLQIKSLKDCSTWTKPRTIIRSWFKLTR